MEVLLSCRIVIALSGLPERGPSGLSAWKLWGVFPWLFPKLSPFLPVPWGESFFLKILRWTEKPKNGAIPYIIRKISTKMKNFYGSFPRILPGRWW
jgi:hypothetical protein